MNVTHDKPSVVQLQFQPFGDEPRLELLLEASGVGTLPTHDRRIGSVVRLVSRHDAFGATIRHVPDLDHITLRIWIGYHV